MRVTFDPEADAAYVYIAARRGGTSARTVELMPDGPEMINVDFDAEGRVFGIEFIPASTLLPPELLAGAPLP